MVLYTENAGKPFVRDQKTIRRIAMARRGSCNVVILIYTIIIATKSTMVRPRRRSETNNNCYHSNNIILLYISYVHNNNNINTASNMYLPTLSYYINKIITT